MSFRLESIKKEIRELKDKLLVSEQKVYFFVNELPKDKEFNQGDIVVVLKI